MAHPVSRPHFLKMKEYSSVWMHLTIGRHSVMVLLVMQLDAKTLPKMSSLKQEETPA